MCPVRSTSVPGSTSRARGRTRHAARRPASPHTSPDGAFAVCGDGWWVCLVENVVRGEVEGQGVEERGVRGQGV